MMYRKLILLQIVLCSFAVSFAQNKELKVFLKDKNALLINKAKLKSGNENLIPAFKKLIKDADQLLSKAPTSVMEKKQTPPSGDMHDYMSLAIYFWPDPSKPDGLPYIRKDGQINPEVDDYKDKSNMIWMSRDVEVLALAYYFSDDNKYADKATQILQTWFLNPDTKMNPNLNFAQAVKGKNDGRGIGIIESRILTSVVDAVGLINGSKSWTSSDQKGIEKWFNDFLEWLMTSKNGIEEFKAKNNHGVWYDEQKLSFALFTGNDEIAINTLNSLKSRLEMQMDTTGFFPAEMERTISLHYMAFMLEPLFNVANMAVSIKEDFWNYTSTSGRSIKKTFEVLKPYLAKEKEWFGQQIKPFEFEDNATPLLAQGFYKYNCKDCREAINNILGKEKSNTTIYHLTTLID